MFKNSHIRVLQVNIDNYAKGGAYELMHNVEFELLRDSKNQIQFDFFTMNKFILSEIQNKHSKIYNANLRKNRFSGHIRLPYVFYKILKQNNYNIIHIHSDTAWKLLLYVIPAKIAGVQNIICHSHSAGIDGDHKSIKKISHYIARALLPSGDGMVYLACSPEAEKWMFQKRKLNKTRNFILKNGINVEKYSFNICERINQRKELNLKDELLIGNSSRISKIKNPIFMVEILKNILAEGISAKLLLVGNSDAIELQKLKNKIKKEKLESKVIIYGPTNNVESMLDAMDIFIFPSQFEGLGLSLIEAQTNGLTCLVSDNVPKFAQISSHTHYLSLKLGSKIWAKKAIYYFRKYKQTDRKYGKKEALNNRYSIKDTTKKLKELYENLNERKIR